MDAFAQGFSWCYCTSTFVLRFESVLKIYSPIVTRDKADRRSTRPMTMPVSSSASTKRQFAHPADELFERYILIVRSNRCCGSNVPGGPLDSDKFERQAHREISELKERSRIRQLEAEQRQLQRDQPGPTQEMTTNPEQKL